MMTYMGPWEHCDSQDSSPESFFISSFFYVWNNLSMKGNPRETARWSMKKHRLRVRRNNMYKKEYQAVCDKC